MEQQQTLDVEKYVLVFTKVISFLKHHRCQKKENTFTFMCIYAVCEYRCVYMYKKLPIIPTYSVQTQPVPNPMSYYMHHSPWWIHRFETLSNHFIELIAPFFTFLGRRMCVVSGAIQILFQVKNTRLLLLLLMTSLWSYSVQNDATHSFSRSQA